jgi:sirohydrochlorin ferrochelatase
VLLLPYFLFAGLHGAGDLERLRQELSRRYSETEFVLCEPLGVHPALVDVVLRRLADGDVTR